MPSPWRTALISAAALAVLVAGGTLVAQMESGDRGILPIDSSGTLEIGGIKVDVAGEDAQSARFAGWRIAQREGFRALWAKINRRPISEAPNLSDSVLDSLVASIVVQQEQIGPNRYIAELGVLFDRARAGALLGFGGVQRRSAPMLLIPLTTSAGSVTSVELKNAWQRAWAQYRTSQSAIDYVRVSGMGVDPLLVNAAQARRPGRGWWRNIIDLYGASNVLVAEVSMHRLYPGGPARASFTGRFGPDGDRLGGFELTARDSADIPRMMAEGVERMDALFTRALAAGVFVHDPSLDMPLPPPPPVEEAVVEIKPVIAALVSLPLFISASDGTTLVAALGQIRSIAGVEAITDRSGAGDLVVAYRGSLSALSRGLVARGWTVDLSGGALRISRPAAAPQPPAPATPPPVPAPAPAP
ncbi:MAG: heavy-metal-associated domain-containing protein [Pseudomonadota bacterium]|nr:heavy-metal-associated domain-containing protein [Pseudomonadota bacterium]